MRKLIFLVLFVSQGALAKWEGYFPARLSEGVAIASHAGHGGFVVFREDYAFSSKVTYTSKIRPLTPATEQILSGFLGVDRDFPLLDRKYGNEVEVTEEGKVYWMAVSFDVLADMRKKLANGQSFTAYVRLLGESGKRWIFLIDGFSSVSRNP
ncbi:MAG TPA: hypothetical protein PLK99_11105 [Burkholderiales bacterium]|nr:hypothetical protein [Burkholderiales bacterium]